MFTNDEDEDIPFPEDEPPSPENRLRGIINGYWRNHEGLNALFLISQRGEFVRIRTPFLYLDGDVVDVFAKENLSGPQVTWTLTDLGESIGNSPPAPHDQIIKDICLTHGVVFENGQLTVLCNQDTLSRCIISLGQAMILLNLASVLEP